MKTALGIKRFVAACSFFELSGTSQDKAVKSTRICRIKRITTLNQNLYLAAMKVYENL